PRPAWRRGHRACRPHEMAAAFRFHWALAPAFSSLPSWPASLHAGCLEQFGKFLACIKQSRLHSVFRNADDFSHLFHRFLVVVNEIDDLPMFLRRRTQTLAQRVTGILFLHRHFRIVGRILDRIGSFVIQFDILPAPQSGKGLESRNRQQPGGNGGSALEFAGLTPDVEKDLTDEILRDLLVPHKSNTEAKHPDMVPSIQHLHGEPVASSDPSDQDLIRSRLCRTQWPSRRVGRVGRLAGSIKKARFCNLPQWYGAICEVPHRRWKKSGPRTAIGNPNRNLGIIILQYPLCAPTIRRGPQ